jgi:hypothetical protein
VLLLLLDEEMLQRANSGKTKDGLPCFNPENVHQNEVDDCVYSTEKKELEVAQTSWFFYHSACHFIVPAGINAHTVGYCTILQTHSMVYTSQPGRIILL